MNTEREQIGWRFWLRWLLANTVGLAVGIAVYVPILVGFASELSVVVQTLISAVAGAVLGTSLGTAQWLVLRRRPFQPGRWVLASTVGGAVGGAVAFATGEAVGKVSGFEIAVAVGFAVIGALVGIAQWLVLRRQLSRAAWWVLASTVGLAGAVATVFAVRGTVGVGAALALLGYGAITGGAIVWLLRRSIAEELSPPQGAA